jgi:UDP-N-acetylmuramoylalanine--D-glutamate ligase
MHSPLYLVLGLGKTGHSIAAYLRRQNKAFVVFDTREEPAGLSAFRAEFPGVAIYLGELPASLCSKITEVISSPGVPLDAPCLAALMASGLPVVGDIEYFAREVKAPVIAITGTNGKSTVTSLVGEMAKAAGLSVVVAGNIGEPVLDYLDDGQHYDLFVLELSSFQLDLTSSLSPIAATILNISPDHLDRHSNYEAYIQAKHRIYRQAKRLVYNRDDALTQPQLKDGQQTSFALDKPASNDWGLLRKEGVYYLAHGDECLLSVDALRIKGQHNWQNALAACALADAVGIAKSSMLQVLQDFPGLAHRSQWVRTLDGVEWINDSKGTNIGATISALSGLGSAIQGKVILIAGGQGKGADFNALRASVADFVRVVVLMGEDADKIAKALQGYTQVLRASSLDAAIQLARGAAQAGDVVLLSPACASFDMFRDFNHRGEAFTAAVLAL